MSARLLTADDRPRSSPDPRLSPASVAACLGRHLSDARRRRIEGVIARRLASVTAIIERPYDPHNAAAVLRSAEALGLLHVHVVPHEAGLFFSSKVTQRADKWLSVYRHERIEDAVAFVRAAGFAVHAAVAPPVGAAPDDDATARIGVERPVALMFGNEHEGLTTAARRLSDASFHLPMYGFSESLNLSVSAALALQTVTARRRGVLGRAGDLPANARDRLRAGYYALASANAARLVEREIINAGASRV